MGNLNNHRAGPLLQDLETLLFNKKKYRFNNTAFPTLESALLLEYPAPAIISLSQIITSTLSQVFKNKNIPEEKWANSKESFFETAKSVLQSERMANIVEEIIESSENARDTSNSTSFEISEAINLTEKLVNLLSWLKAQDLIKQKERSEGLKKEIKKKADLINSIYNVIGYSLKTKRSLSQSIAFLLFQNNTGAHNEYIQIYISDDIEQLLSLLEDQSLSDFTDNYDIDQSLIITELNDTSFSQQLSMHGEIKSIASYLEELISYRNYVSAIRERVQNRRVVPESMTLSAEWLSFNDDLQEYTVESVDQVSNETANILRNRSGNILILSDSGGGKTHICEQILDDLLASRKVRFTLYLHLADWSYNESLIEFLVREVGKFSKLSNHELASLFKILISEGYLISLLDGFDECISSNNMEDMLFRFAEISELLSGSSRVVLTSRISFFQSTPELRELLHKKAYTSEKIQHTLKNGGINPLLLPNFEVLRLRRIKVNIESDESQEIELTPFEYQLLMSRPAKERRKYLLRSHTRIKGGAIIKKDIESCLPQSNTDGLIDKLTKFIGKSYQENKLTFHPAELFQVAGGGFFSNSSPNIEGCFIKKLLMKTSNDYLRFRHLAYNEYLYARFLVYYKDKVCEGIAITESIRRYYYELKSRLESETKNSELILPSGVPFIVGGSESPACIKKLKKAIKVQKYTVSVAQYRKFLKEAKSYNISEYEHPAQPSGLNHEPFYTKLKIPDYYKSEIYLNYPAICISWWSAYTYAKFMGGRLLTANEWEFAARGFDGRIFPWGDKVDIDIANSADYWAEKELLTWEEWKKHFDRSEIRGGLPLPPTKFSDNCSPFGIVSMAGNVWEWTATTNSNYTQAGIMGGSFDNPFRALKSSIRCANNTNGISNAIGFRICEDYKL